MAEFEPTATRTHSHRVRCAAERHRGLFQRQPARGIRPPVEFVEPAVELFFDEFGNDRTQELA
jgi:hypothetical protein